MWVAHSSGGGGWISIVAHRYKPDHLMVRARVQDHITSMWPDAEVYTIDGSHDYQFRADILRKEVAETMRAYIESIVYEDYKDSIWDSDLYDALVAIWTVLVRTFGRGPLY